VRLDRHLEQLEGLRTLALGNLMGSALDDGEENSTVDLRPARMLIVGEEGSAA
jgi:hypothetical protein